MGPEFLEKPLADTLRENGLSAHVGPPTGYVLKFSNGLVVYLSGDTGITSEQDLVVRQYYRANLAWRSAAPRAGAGSGRAGPS